MLTLPNGTTLDMTDGARYLVRDPNGMVAGVFRQSNRALMCAERVDAAVVRVADVAAVQAETDRRLADDRAAWDAEYGDACAALVALLSPIQAAAFRKTGLFPLSAIRRELTGSAMESILVEELSALLRSGTWDVDVDHERNGSSAPLGDWERVARFYPGKHSGPRYVRVPWMVPADEWSDRAGAYRADVEADELLSVSSCKRWSPALAS